VEDFHAALRTMPQLREQAARYAARLIDFITQSAACNALHELEQRSARWLLVTHDRVPGDEFRLTHEFLAAMLGVGRPTVTLAVGALQRAGLVEHRRGAIKIVDRAGLEEAACECYAVMRKRLADT
jgi:CRP-like cAMP-binding protein